MKSEQFNLSNKVFEYGYSAGWINNREAIHLEDVKKFIKTLKEKMWKHNRRFEGIKNKTCLPLDYVEDIIDELAGSKLIDAISTLPAPTKKENEIK